MCIKHTKIQRNIKLRTQKEFIQMTALYFMKVLHLISSWSPWGKAIDSNSLLSHFLNVGNSIFKNKFIRRCCLRNHSTVFKPFTPRLYNTTTQDMLGKGLSFSDFQIQWNYDRKKIVVQILSFLPSYFLYNASAIAKMTDIWQVSVSIRPRQLIKVFLSMHQLSQRQKPISIDYFAD